MYRLCETGMPRSLRTANVSRHRISNRACLMMLISFRSRQPSVSDRYDVHAPVMLIGGYATFILQILLGKAKTDCGIDQLCSTGEKAMISILSLPKYGFLRCLPAQ